MNDAEISLARRALMRELGEYKTDAILRDKAGLQSLCEALKQTMDVGANTRGRHNQSRGHWHCAAGRDYALVVTHESVIQMVVRGVNFCLFYA